jgi:hypothetical protein
VLPIGSNFSEGVFLRDEATNFVSKKEGAVLQDKQDKRIAKTAKIRRNQTEGTVDRRASIYGL